MRTRTAALVGLALLTLLAGCAALDGGDEREFEGVSYSDGAGPDGFANTTEVLATHQDRLADDSYRVAYNLTYARPGQVANTTTVVASNASQGRQLLDADLPGRTLDRFATPDTRFTRNTFRNQTTVNSQPLGQSMAETHHQEARPGQLLETVVSAPNYTVNRTDTIAGQDVLWYESREASANATGQVPGNVTQLNASVAVDQEGRIWRAEMVAVGQTNGTAELFIQEFRIEQVGGVTVERPAWVDGAAE